MTIVPRTDLPIAICAVIPTEAMFSVVLEDLGCSVVTLPNGQIIGRNGQANVLPMAHDALIDTIVLSCDALILTLDGNLGLGPEVIDMWRQASEWDIPRLITVVNSVTGRADFDEVVAISERVLDDSVVVRYLPLENDDSNGVDGIYDILTSELHVKSPTGPQIRSAEPEHVALTADKREILIEDIAHAAMSDEQLNAISTGMPVSIPAVEQAWMDSHLVSVMPIDEGIAAHIASSWMNARESRWIPMVQEDDQTFSADEVTQPLGIGVGRGIARMWNRDRSVLLERQPIKKAAQRDEEYFVLGAFAVGRSIRQGDTLRPHGSIAELTEPRF